MINQNQDKGWDWHEISCNPGITMQNINNHPKCPWVYKQISYNRNLTIDFIDQYPDIKWNWQAISRYAVINKQTEIWNITNVNLKKYART